ncbi:MAG: hypothetical protein ACOYVK_16845 [Bacillota bacterium]
MRHRKPGAAWKPPPTVIDGCGHVGAGFHACPLVGFHDRPLYFISIAHAAKHLFHNM